MVHFCRKRANYLPPMGVSKKVVHFGQKIALCEPLVNRLEKRQFGNQISREKNTKKGVKNDKEKHKEKCLHFTDFE